MPTTMEIRALLSACAIDSAEWMPILNKVLGEEQREVRDSAIYLLQALQQKAQGWLTEDDLRLLLEGQRDIARIRANNQSIIKAVRYRAAGAGRRAISYANCRRLSSGSRSTAC